MSKPDLNAVDFQMQLLSNAGGCQTVYQLAREVNAQVRGVHWFYAATLLVRDVFSANPDWKHVDTIDGHEYWEYLP